MAPSRTTWRTGISITPSPYIELRPRGKRDWGTTPRVNKTALSRIQSAYEKLGLDYERAQNDLEYVDEAFVAVKNKMKAAGVDIPEDADIQTYAKAYDGLTESQKRIYATSTGETPSTPVAQPASDNVTVKNGTPKAAASSPQNARAATPALTPRNAIPTSVSTVPKYNRVSSDDTGVRVNGAPLESGNTAARSQLRNAQSEALTTEALQRRRNREDLLNEMSSDTRRRFIEKQNVEDQMDAAWKERRDRKRAEREAAQQARMDKRYESRSLTGMTDWKNLGRDSTVRNFGARGAEESDESWNARSAVVGRVEEMRNRLKNMGVKDPEKNEFYANNPNRMRDVAGLTKLFNDAVKSGTLTDAQLDGLEKTLDSYETEGNKTRRRIQAAVAMRDAENVRKYRGMYGMEDTDVFSDDDVKRFHADRQAAERKSILQNMQVAPGQGEEEGRSQRISEFSDNWIKLMNNGLDTGATFRRAMADANSRKAYQESVAGIALDDPERNDKVDQIKRRFIMNQAMEDAGLGDKTLRAQVNVTGLTEEQADAAAASAQARTMSEDLPGTRGLNPVQSVVDTKNVLTAPVVALAPRKRDRETQQVAKGGSVLRPRRRAV